MDIIVFVTTTWHSTTHIIKAINNETSVLSEHILSFNVHHVIYSTHDNSVIDIKPSIDLRKP